MVEEERLIAYLTYRRQRLLVDSDGLSDKEFDNAEKCSTVKANVMCSDVETFDSRHLLILDIDCPVEVLESSSGNSHIVIGRALSFEALTEILDVLALHGVVQKAWAKAAKDRGYAALRAPGITKNDLEDYRSLDENGDIESEESYNKAKDELRKRGRG